MTTVTVVATVRVKAGREDEALEIMRSFVEPSHTEEGCVRYALHRDTSDPQRFVIVEVWRSQPDLDAHFTKPYMGNLAKLTDMVEEPPSIWFLEPVSMGDTTKGTL
ncbi:MAG: antibiotic biosynthesis monooxygenase [Acidimicrobiia bacterium]|nr:antibiotic biosynthesis monooxygenase [Acidimicrobiia bacterium]